MNTQLINLIVQKKAFIGIVGLGYVGLPLSLRYAEAGYNVVGFDIDSEKVEKLNQGKSYIGHISPSKIANLLKSGFEAITDFTRVGEVDALILCVPTPPNKCRELDLSSVTDTTDMVVPTCAKDKCCH